MSVHSLSMLWIMQHVAFYPLVLTIKVYDYNLTIMKYLCKPIAILASKIHSKSNIRTSIIDAFSTFFLLSLILSKSYYIINFELLVFCRSNLELRSGNII